MQKKQFEGKGKIDLLLTTYPEEKSRNVGDNLISYSALKVARKFDKEYNPIVYFREKNLDEVQGKVKSILAPGFSVSNETYPKLFKLYSDESRLKNFFPIGCSFQYPGVYPRVFEEFSYTSATLRFLERLAEKHGALHCRDELIVKMLKKHGIPGLYSGDMALYDPEMIGVSSNKVSDIKSVVFTVQHTPSLNKQAINVINTLRAFFPRAKLYISLHSKKNKNDRIIVEHAKKIGYEVLELSGDVENLNRYRNVDLHVGYRLHGHIHFIRNRKPSVLIVEDVRSYGFSLTPGTNIGCFSSLDEASCEMNENITDDVCMFLERQMESNFAEYEVISKFIDGKYKKVISPFFKKLSRRRWLEKINPIN